MTAPSTAARLARQAERLESAMTAAAARLTTALPALSSGDAIALLAAVVPGVRGPARYLEELAGHLAAHPDALTSGSTRCPMMLLRLAAVLHDAGYPVVRPGCAHCGKIRADLRQWRPEGRVCGTCDKRSRKGTCARCGAAGATIEAKRPEGGICSSCYRADPLVTEECSAVRQGPVPVSAAARRRLAMPLMLEGPRAHLRVLRQDSARRAARRHRAYCHQCYSRQRRPRRLCGRCGRLGRIGRNAAAASPTCATAATGDRR